MWEVSPNCKVALPYKVVKILTSVQQLTQCLLHMPFAGVTVLLTKQVYEMYQFSFLKALEQKYKVQYKIIPTLTRATVKQAEEVLSTLPKTESVFCIGDGEILEIAKYVCAIKSVPLICVPIRFFYRYSFSKLCMLTNRVVPQMYVANAPYAVFVCEEMFSSLLGLQGMFASGVSAMCAWMEYRFQKRMYAKNSCNAYLLQVQKIVKSMVKHVYESYKQNVSFRTPILQALVRLNFCTQLWWEHVSVLFPTLYIEKVLQTLCRKAACTGEMVYVVTSVYMGCMQAALQNKTNCTGVCYTRVMYWAKKYWHMPCLVFLNTHTPMPSTVWVEEEKMICKTQRHVLMQDVMRMRVWLKKAFYVWKMLARFSPNTLPRLISQKRMRVALGLGVELSKAHTFWWFARNQGVVEKMIRNV